MSDKIMQTGKIVDVKEVLCDLEVGQSLRLAVRVAAAGTGEALVDANVVFRTLPGPEQVRVTTDSYGWAKFVHKATVEGGVQIMAVVEGSQAESASHTFNIAVVKAGVWDDATMILDSVAASEAVWGAQSRFPRITPATHTITLKATAGSPLLDRQVQLGVISESSLAELGITNVNPALGSARLLTPAGLTWTFTSSATAGGTYFLTLAASRLINQSAENHISLGPTPPAPALAT